MRAAARLRAADCGSAASPTAARAGAMGRPARDVDFFDVKGDLEALVAPRRVVTQRIGRIRRCIPAAAARVPIDGVAAGWLGELHPRLVRHYELPQAPIVFELDLRLLVRAAAPGGQAVSQLPIVRRDLARRRRRGRPGGGCSMR